jgi:hypothetical protein
MSEHLTEQYAPERRDGDAEQLANPALQTLQRLFDSPIASQKSARVPAEPPGEPAEARGYSSRHQHQAASAMVARSEGETLYRCVVKKRAETRWAPKPITTPVAATITSCRITSQMMLWPVAPRSLVGPSIQAKRVSRITREDRPRR